MLKLPSVEFLQKRGRFLGYHLPGWYCCYRLKKENYLVVDGTARSNGRYYQYVEPYKNKIGDLVNGANQYTGEIQ